MTSYTYNGVTYELISKTKLTTPNISATHAICVKRPKGRKTYHGLQYKNGTVWIAETGW